ncbi:hypothetical protein LguiA_013409 [Lonicera macranthoides]
MRVALAVEMRVMTLVVERWQSLKRRTHEVVIREIYASRVGSGDESDGVSGGVMAVVDERR